MSRLDGASVLVVGGSSGIGLGAAKAAAAAGAKVTIASRSQARLDQAAAEAGGCAVAALDAGNEGALRAFFAGRPAFDHVVVSVGSGGRGLVTEQAAEDAAAAFDAKFWAFYRVARTAKIAPDGSLTAVSGEIGHRPARGAALISAINAALEGLTRGLALDFAPVRVNTVCPGMIETPMWNRMPKADREAMYAAAAARLPVRRIGQPEDVAEAILFLMTNRFATGTTLMVDGGALLV
jgi:NAD(P)-dependent dehydrogenase (short-subunit alcohol dehydrogenase family)